MSTSIRPLLFTGVVFISAFTGACGLKTGGISAEDPNKIAAAEREAAKRDVTPTSVAATDTPPAPKREVDRRDSPAPTATATQATRKDPEPRAEEPKPTGGCGFRKIELSAEKRGDNWGAPAVAHDDGKYTPSHCNNLPEQSWIPARFEAFEDMLARRCGKNAKIMFDADQWSERPAASGPARRSVTLMCWTKD
jgi:hypothetical protein